MNEVVKYSNQFNQLPLRKFTSTELDLLMVLCSKMKNQDTNELTFSFEQLKTLSKYKPTANERFIRDLKRTNKKLLDLDFMIETESKIYQFALFPTFVIDKDLETLTIAVNEKFKFVLNELDSKFTTYELEEFVTLKSEYAKKMYKILKQYRKTGECYLTIEEFRKQLTVAKSYQMNDINKKVLKPIQEELKDHFKNLRIQKKKSRKRGNPIVAINFFFEAEEPKKYQVFNRRKGRKEILPDYDEEAKHEEKSELAKRIEGLPKEEQDRIIDEELKRLLND